LEIFGIRLVGINAENLTKLLLTVAVVIILFLLRRGAMAVVNALFLRYQSERARF
jgi:hypothetical protein